ncbi:saccharopine dehydrogenase family protein [Edaphocola aurantiacus]|uniref:saccharopine dehydrogenase family protein n=1 Tax=Edaphocola aurantiacus TaxID=2601682 RepID=UPI001C95C098|nr:saccharopine dehydrogenase NADP-binding domain-containing protein [Edaphocola aurantiacus]
MAKDKIVIVGGYGAVGSSVAKWLSAWYPGRVVVAGRSLQKAKNLQEKLEHTVDILQLDIDHIQNVSFLADAALLIMCIDQPSGALAELCIDKGVHYIDISATPAVLHRLESLQDKALAQKVTLLLSVGLAPGLTNLLGKWVTQSIPDQKMLQLFVLLGLGEDHGEQAFQWTFDNLHQEYTIQDQGKGQQVKSFTQPLTTDLLGKRKFYLFNFSDQHILARTQNLDSISTRMAFDHKGITALIAGMRKLGFTRLMRLAWVQRIMIKLFRKVKMGTDVFAVKAQSYHSHGVLKEASISGYGEGAVTALVAALLAKDLLDKQTPLLGVQHIDTYVEDVPEFLSELRKYNPQLQVKL